jgi:hypothetical protein
MSKGKRCRRRQSLSLEDRLTLEAQKLRAEARRTSSFQTRIALLKKAQQMDKARDISTMLSSPVPAITKHF